MLPRVHRLPSHEISAIRAESKRIRTEYFDFYARSGLARFAVIVGTHIDKRAVTRNRMRRLVQEAIRLRTPLSSVDGVFVIRKRFPKESTYETVAALVHPFL